MILELLLSLALLLYLILLLRTLAGIHHTRDQIHQTASPFVSVVIAARNEEEHLPRCLQSVVQQTYSNDSYEIIVVNDNSTDGTETICLDFAGRHSNVTYVSAQEDKALPGKTNALDQGIQKARGEIILVTDADCTVPPTWVEFTAKRYGPDVGLVGGMTVQKASTWFEGMQSLDWAYLLGLAAAAVARRNPLSTIGNNLSFRKSAYQEIGGYRKIPFSVTEDFMLFQSIVKTKKWEYLYPVDGRVLVVSQPCATLRELVRQKHRWGRGGLDMKLSGMLIMVVGFATHALLLTTLVMGSFFVAASCLLAKIAADYFFLEAILRRLERTDLLKYIYLFEAYFILYVLLLPFIVFFGGRVIWKGRAY
jgi:cellulose synthase/poly-beta-1,6-N-acetylglucosamine synthase-like glycosyltransferase